MTRLVRQATPEWLSGADVPREWQSMSLKHLVRFSSGETITAESIEESGRFPVYGANGLRGFTAASTHCGVHILVGRVGALCGNVHLVEGEFWASEHALVGTTQRDLCRSWLRYLLQAMDLGQYSQSTAQPVIAGGRIEALRVEVPPLGEQRAIADYLDHETARIDTLIEEQQRLVEMLGERRRAVISAVLGEHAGFGERLKWHLEDVDQRAGADARSLPLMSVSIAWGVKRRDEVTTDEARAEDLSHYKVCRSGDLVINRMRAFQGALGLAPADGIVSPDYAVLRHRDRLDGRWLAMVMKSDRFVAEMAMRVKGIGSAELGSARTPRINVSDLADIRVEVPSIEAQVAEVGRVTAEVSDIAALEREASRFIDLARERRSALIAAAVTGQIDVREAS